MIILVEFCVFFQQKFILHVRVCFVLKLELVFWYLLKLTCNNVGGNEQGEADSKQHGGDDEIYLPSSDSEISSSSHECNLYRLYLYAFIYLFLLPK